MGEGIESRRSGRTSRIGLALAGGGPEGAVYEIGALRALDEAVDGLDLNDLYIYVGVSAGAFINACLANRLTSAQMCRAIVSHDPGDHPFVPETFLTPAVRGFVKGGLALPRLLSEALVDYLGHFSERTVLGSLTRLSRALPIGLFDNEPLRLYLERIYQLKGRSNDFRTLGKRLIVVASDLDSGQPVRFGEAGFDHVPISRAVQASSALPGLYSPVEIDGRHYVDGVLLKTLHASVALEAGADLVLCVNPIVPVDTVMAADAGHMERGSLLEWGLPTVLSQTFRTLIHSRMEVGMATYESKFKDADVVRLEPGRDDAEMFFTNVFGFAERRAVCQRAYQTTRQYLLAHLDTLEPVFARHGLTLRRDVLLEERDLWAQVGVGSTGRKRAPRKASGGVVVERLDQVLDRLERLLGEREAAAPAGPAPHADPAPLEAEPALALV
jgi:NTE family protein